MNPYAEYLQLPKEILKPRRTNAHYLQFIEVVTYYSQYQREKKVDESTGEEYIETTIEDIRNANELLKEILLRKSDLLTGNSRNQIEKFKGTLENLGQTFTNLQLRYSLKVTKTTAQRYLNGWQEVGLIKKMQNKETQTYYYQLIDENDYKNLENKINEILEDALLQIGNRNTETYRNITTDVSDKTNVEKEKEQPNHRNAQKDKAIQKTEIEK